LVVFNSGDFLEIALYKSNIETVGSASTLLGLSIMNSVSINFITKPVNSAENEVLQNTSKVRDF